MSDVMSTALPDSEASSLFNPAFCAVLLNKAVSNYEGRAGAAMPITFAYLILPSALHKPTRDALPRAVSASMWSWIRANPLVHMDFAVRVRTFRPFTSAAITYGLRHHVLAAAPGALTGKSLRRRPRSLRPSEDWVSCVDASEFLGKWFGGSDADEATTLAGWGVRP